MNPILLGVALALAQPPATPDRAADRATAAAPIDGAWTVVSLEKDGKPVADVKDMTVTVKDGTVTFAGGDEGNRVKAMRLAFGPNGTFRATDADVARPAAAGDAAATGDAAAARNGHAKGRTGVYVLTADYLAVCVHDDAARAGDTGVRPAGGTDQTETKSDTPKAGQAGTAMAKSYCSVILKRSGTRPGNGSGDR